MLKKENYSKWTGRYRSRSSRSVINIVAGLLKGRTSDRSTAVSGKVHRHPTVFVLNESTPTSAHRTQDNTGQRRTTLQRPSVDHEACLPFQFVAQNEVRRDSARENNSTIFFQTTIRHRWKFNNFPQSLLEKSTEREGRRRRQT